MNRQVPFGLIATALILVAQGAIPAAAQDDAMAACKATGSQYVAAIATGDSVKVAALVPQDGILNAPEGIIEGRQAIAAFQKAFVMPGISQTDEETNAEAVGGTILCSGKYAVTFAPGFPMKGVAGQFSKVLVRDGGGWRIKLLAYNYTPPPLPQQQAQGR